MQKLSEKVGHQIERAIMTGALKVNERLQTIIDGLTLPGTELQARMKDVVKDIQPEGVARSSVPV